MFQGGYDALVSIYGANSGGGEQGEGVEVDDGNRIRSEEFVFDSEDDSEDNSDE